MTNALTPTQVIQPYDSGYFIGNFKMTPVGFTPIEGRKPDFDEWIHVGRKLMLIESGIQWAIGDWLAYGEFNFGEKYAQAIDTTDRDPQTLMNYQWVANKFPISRRRENLTFSHHAEVAALTFEQQEALLTLAASTRMSSKALRIQVQKLKNVLKAGQPIPDGKYRLIYADPPWNYEVYDADTGTGRSAESHYPTMELEDIIKLPVGNLAHDDCVLLLWVTNPQLPAAFKVIEAWGFEYKTVAFTWAKLIESAGSKDTINALDDHSWFVGNGFWTRANSEQCLLCTRGNPFRLEMDVRELIVAAHPGEHSKKPDDAYRRIERMFPGPFIELFARRRWSDKWTVWGNQAPEEEKAA
jgi:N6-adenosine-specific RNA methylase IME4